MTPARRLAFLLTLALMLSVAACTASGGYGHYDDYTLVDQGAGAARRLTATANAQHISFQATQLAFQLVQTEQAGQLTQAAVVAQATAQARAYATGTARAEVNLTATVNAQVTQTALAALQQTATTTAQMGLAQATQQAHHTQVAQAEQAARSAANWRLFYGILVTGALVAVLIILIAGLNVLRQHLPDLIEAWQLKYRTIPRANGDPLIAFGGSQTGRLVDPSRAAGPVVWVTPTGAQLEAVPPEARLQAEIIAGEQRVRALQAIAARAFPHHPEGAAFPETAFQTLRAHFQSSEPEDEPVEGHFVILPPEHPEVSAILNDIEPRLSRETGG